MILIKHKGIKTSKFDIEINKLFDPCGLQAHNKHKVRVWIESLIGFSIHTPHNNGFQLALHLSYTKWHI